MKAVTLGADGLIPAVAQDAATGEVLMVAYVNEDALRRTIETGEAWYWSRSRGVLWRKGAQSGNVQRVREIRLDCDGDALLLIVEQTGQACHTGHHSCFHRDVEGAERASRVGGILDDVFAVIEDRAARRPEGSYTASLLQSGPEAIAAKVTEESAELIRAAREETDRRVAEEAADLLFHTMVLLASRGVHLDEVRRELVRRRNDR